MTFAARFTKTLDKILRTYTDQDYPEEVINESRDSLLILNQLLEREASTQEYVDFLSDRYAIIQNTFSDFKANLHTRANVASMALSKFLSQEHLKKTGKVIDLSLIHISEPTRPY